MQGLFVLVTMNMMVPDAGEKMPALLRVVPPQILQLLSFLVRLPLFLLCAGWLEMRLIASLLRSVVPFPAYQL